MKKSTLTDVSAKTGLSITTISRVLNGKSKEFRISKETQEKVKSAIKELGYKPNFAAQSLRNSTTHTIGLLIPRIENPFFANIASIIIQEANKYSYPVMVIDTLENPVEEDRALDTLLSRNVDGIIMAPCSDSSQRIAEVREQVPIVLVDRYYEDTSLPYVATDNYAGAFDATQLLIANGHKDILCLQGSPLSITSNKRVAGYCDAMKKAGLEEYINVRGNDFSTHNGYIETKLAMMSNRKFTAVFALSSTILLGSMKALHESHKSVPTDVSIVSFDNNLFLDYMNPPVTRVCQPAEYIGIVAVKMLMDTIKGAEIKQPAVLLSPTITYGNSIAQRE
jgi:LacI family transcriptional regulator